MKPRPAEYRAKIIATARAMSPCTMRSLLAEVGPDESGTTPIACTVRGWLQTVGITPISVMEAHRIRLLAIARTMDVPTVSRAIEAAGPTEDGREPTWSTVHGWFVAAGITAVSVKSVYREHIIATARAMERPTAQSVIDAAGSDANGHVSKHEVVSRWLREAGIKSYGPGGRWSNEIKAEAVRMVVGSGMSPYTARKRFIDSRGSSPSPETIAQWCGVGIGSKPPKTPRPALVPVSAADAEGRKCDTWQAAWDAAEGLTGAAWAEAVMREWLPANREHTAENYEPCTAPKRLGRRLAA